MDVQDNQSVKGAVRSTLWAFGFPVLLPVALVMNLTLYIWLRKTDQDMSFLAIQIFYFQAVVSAFMGVPLVIHFFYPPCTISRGIAISLGLIAVAAIAGGYLGRFTTTSPATGDEQTAWWIFGRWAFRTVYGCACPKVPKGG